MLEELCYHHCPIGLSAGDIFEKYGESDSYEYVAGHLTLHTSLKKVSIDKTMIKNEILTK